MLWLGYAKLAVQSLQEAQSLLKEMRMSFILYELHRTARHIGLQVKLDIMSIVTHASPNLAGRTS